MLSNAFATTYIGVESVRANLFHYISMNVISYQKRQSEPRPIVLIWIPILIVHIFFTIAIFLTTASICILFLPVWYMFVF